MYSKELEELIEMVLADGEITEKERKVLHKRALVEGVDPDELDIVIEGRLAKMQKEQRTALPPSPPPVQAENKSSSTKFGVVHNCPQCGAVVEAGSIKCVECGYTFRGVKANSSREKLNSIINEINQRHSSIKKSLWNVLSGEDKRDEISEAIKNFPIPNDKEDLLEFLTFLKPLATVKTMSNSYDPYLTPAYKMKYNECLNKANVFFADDPQFKLLLSPQKKGLFGGFFGK